VYEWVLSNLNQIKASRPASILWSRKKTDARWGQKSLPLFPPHSQKKKHAIVPHWQPVVLLYWWYSLCTFF